MFDFYLLCSFVPLYNHFATNNIWIALGGLRCYLYHPLFLGHQKLDTSIGHSIMIGIEYTFHIPFARSESNSWDEDIDIIFLR